MEKGRDGKKRIIPMRNTFFVIYTLIVLVFISFILNGMWFSGRIKGLSNAINYAGSERMRTFQIAAFIHRAHEEQSPAREETLGHVKMEMDRFEEILNALIYGNKKYDLKDVTDKEVDEKLLKLLEKWEESIKPLLHGILIASVEDQRKMIIQYDYAIHEFVEKDINETVVMMVERMEDAERIFITTRYILTAIGALLLLISILYIRRHILVPVRLLTSSTEKAVTGDYSAKTTASANNELMLLSSNFNAMTDRVQSTISSMDETIRNKTNDLSIANAKMQSFFDTAPEAIITIKAEDRTIAFFSKGAEKIFGYREGEVLGKNINMLMPEPFSSSHEAYVGNYLRTGEKKVIGISRETKGLRRNGEIFDIDLAVNETVTQGGHFFNGIIRDISARTAAEKEIRKLTNAIEQSVESVVVTSREGKIEYVNPAFEKVTGYSASEVLGKNPRVLKSGKMSKEFYRDMWRSILDGNVWRGEFINRKKNGEIYYEDATISPIKDEKGEVTHFVGMKNDITARKIAEKELEHKNGEIALMADYERSYAAVMEMFSSTYDEKAIFDWTLSTLADRHPFPVSAIYLYDEWKGGLSRVSARGVSSAAKTEFALGEGLVGQAAAEKKRIIVTGSSDAMLFSIDAGIAEFRPSAIVVDPITYNEKIMGVMVLAATKELNEADIKFIDRLTSQMGVALNGVNQYNNMKELSGQLRVKSDEVSQKNQELQHSNKLKSEFLANMSHELRTPLNAIIGFSEVLKDGLLGDLSEDQHSYITDIFNSGQHLLALINDILDLSKIEAGKMTLDLENTYIPAIIENSLSVVKEKAMTHGIRLEMKIDEAVGEAVLDARKFKQIVYNLLSNAVKFTPDKGKVTIEARIDGSATGEKMLEFSVSDTGIGMTRDEMTRLFKPFEQLDGSASRKFEGTGLGLAMVKRLAELHGGTVDVESAKGEGSRFIVRIPYRTEVTAKPVEPAQKKAATDRTASGDKRERLVLIIEDDDSAADLLRLQLESAGYNTTRASDAETGLEMAGSMRPDLITLDIMLADMDGWHFLENIKKDAELASIPVVIISIVADTMKGASLGASKVLQKPVQKEELIKSIETLGLFPLTGGGRLKVLVVDDDPKAVEIVSRVLDDKGITVIRAYGGQQGIDLAMSELPDLIILDLMMPEVSGFDVVRAMRSQELTAVIPIIILTAKIVTDEDRQMLSGGVMQIVQKSEFRNEDFIAEVRRATLIKRQAMETVRAAIDVSEQEGAEKAKEDAADAGTDKTPLVLVIEDNPREASVLRTHLEEAGYRVSIANNGKEGIDLLFRERPALITLDLMMPEMDGFAFAQEMLQHKEFSGIPVVIVSGIADGDRGLPITASAFLRKPINRKELLDVISSLDMNEGFARRRILLIDDDPRAIKIISSYLDDESWEVIKAYGGKEGLELARAHRPDIIVTDLMMPEVNGFEVLGHLKLDEATRDIPVVVLTAKILSMEEKESLLIKAMNVVEKGEFEIESLINDISTIIRRKRRNGAI